jgi:hypothetical protein
MRYDRAFRLRAPILPSRTATSSTLLPAPAARKTAPRPAAPSRSHKHKVAPSAKSLSPTFRFPDLASDSGANRLLGYALGASIVLHLVLLAIRFHPFDLGKLQDSAPALEVALVNAKSVSKPTKADILAQANLDGGGNTDAPRKAKTPLPALQKALSGEVAVATQRIEALEIEAKALMTRINGAPTPQAVPKPSRRRSRSSSRRRASSHSARWKRCAWKRASRRTSRPISSGRSDVSSARAPKSIDSRATSKTGGRRSNASATSTIRKRRAS